jgi:hypothetical protein
MILHKKPTRFAKNNPKNILVRSHKKLGIIMVVKRTFSKNIDRKISPQQINASHNLNNIPKKINVLTVKKKN